MAVTYEPLATSTLGSAASSVTFSSISGSYTDLILVCFAKHATANTNMRIRVNSDTGSNYSVTYLEGSGSAAGSGRASNATSGILNFINNNTNFGTVICNFQNYANSTTYKTFIGRSGEASTNTQANVNLWRSTSAITAIQVYPDTGNFAVDSSFTIYGIKSA